MTCAVPFQLQNSVAFSASSFSSSFGNVKIILNHKQNMLPSPICCPRVIKELVHAFSFIGTAEKLLLMRSRFQFVFPPFHFQNGGRRIKNEHVIVMAFGNILPTQGSYKQLGYFGQSPVQMFRLWSKGSKWCCQFSQAIKTALPRGNFQLFQIHLR